MARYAHILLFACPECYLPISVSRISDYGNLEKIDAQKLNIWCHYCHSSADVLAVLAKKHTVESWPLSDGNGATSTLAPISDWGSPSRKGP